VAILDLELGRTAQARTTFEELAAQGVADHLRRAGLDAVVLLAELCAALGDRRRAAPLYDVLLPYAAHVCSVPPVRCASPGAVARYLGLLAATLARWHEAEQHFDRALAVHARMGALPLVAHTARDYAAMLLAWGRDGDLPRARHLLELAAAHYTGLGMTQHAARARTLLASGGTTTAGPAAPSYRDGLTAREVDVLRLLAIGKSNREIAAELVVSVRTAEHHVAAIYAKIGAHRRLDAAAYALRHHLLPPAATGQ
jgi:DNA-binding NarL/FixJ family response regulator